MFKRPSRLDLDPDASSLDVSPGIHQPLNKVGRQTTLLDCPDRCISKDKRDREEPFADHDETEISLAEDHLQRPPDGLAVVLTMGPEM